MFATKLTDVRYSTILKVSAPTILSSLSASIMSILDVLILAKYSTLAMTGASSAYTWCYAFQCSTIALVFITGALVGHYNGAGKYKFAGMPVWQMIWFSLSLFVISIPLSQIVARYCVPTNLHEYGIPYLKIVMGLSPIFCTKVAISAFLVSIGKGFIVSLSSFIAIIVNATLDIFLIFYCNQGTTGAAIGTIMAGFSELIFLSCFFFSSNIRSKYGTLNCKLRIKRLCSYLKLGVFSSLGHVFESIVYSSIYYVLASASTDKALTQTIVSNLWSLLICVAAGLEKGVMSITANLLGANIKEKISVLFKRSVNIHFFNASLLLIFILSCSDLILSNYVNINEISPELHQHLLNVLRLAWITFIFDGILWIEAGILEAGGDMNYMMLTIASCLGMCVALPIFGFMNTNTLSVEMVWTLYTLSSLSNVLLLFMRYKSNKWIKIHV
ncbi:MAG: hypothetical protein IJ848_01885 [Alphaproteobacteria bacterium]|nr:hypothetical protein [Alphaproteobacteria bacterium]